MATNDTITRLVSGSGAKDIAPLALGTSTTETTFSTNGLVLGTTTVVAAAPAILRIADMGNVPMYWDKGRPFKVTAWGTVTTLASETFTLKLWQVPASIITTLAVGVTTSCNSVLVSTARTVATTTASFMMEAKFQWNATASLLQGQITYEINQLVDVYAATTLVTTATALDTELNFIMTGKMGTGTAGDIVNLNEFAIEPI